MGIKKIVSLSLLAFSVSGISLLAHAEGLTFTSDLSLSNNTEFPVTSKINGKTCSNQIPGGSGVTKPHEQNHIVSGTLLGLVCGLFSTTCSADVHLDDHCGDGSKIGTVVLNMKTGFQSASMVNSHYQIVGSGFSMTLNAV